MQRSDNVAELIAALVKAQAVMKNPPFDKENPHFRSKYTSLAAVIETVMPVLTKQNLALTQMVSTSEGVVQCETVLWHTSGEYIASTLSFPVQKADAQGYGAVITYARRYGLMALCGVSGDDDDDANASLAKSTEKGSRLQGNNHTQLRGTSSAGKAPILPVNDLAPTLYDPEYKTPIRERISQLLADQGLSESDIEIWWGKQQAKYKDLTPGLLESVYDKLVKAAGKKPKGPSFDAQASATLDQELAQGD